MLVMPLRDGVRVNITGDKKLLLVSELGVTLDTAIQDFVSRFLDRFAIFLFRCTEQFLKFSMKYFIHFNKFF